MKEIELYPYQNNINWGQAWTSNAFRNKVIIALIIFLSIVLLLPYFFAFIEARQGIVLNDWLLQMIPPRDFSATIFICVWSTSLLILVRSFQQPAIFLMAIYYLIGLTLVRIVTISIVPLDPPISLIPLVDPLTSLTYGGSEIFITKDLFFSGHTSNLFMFYLCLQKKRDKQFALAATAIVGCLVLVQHVHYFIDVLGAIVFTYSLVKLTRDIQFFKVDIKSEMKKELV